MTELQEPKQVAVSVALDVSNTKHRCSSRSLFGVVGMGSKYGKLRQSNTDSGTNSFDLWKGNLYLYL